ncbi:MAG: hypothetical protein C0618_12345 [Desulfuromonas sp.]|nr:MAG: hypothetical protein C0618_12345 [Desulfuromonas sp.]
MSLIIQMLKDLEKRRAAERDLPTDITETRHEVNPASPRPVRRTLFVVAILTVFLAGGLLLLIRPTDPSAPIGSLSGPVSPAGSVAETGMAPHPIVSGGEEQPPADQLAVVGRQARLLNVDLFESNSSARLMLEFDRMPRFALKQNQESGQLRISLEGMSAQLPVMNPLQGAMIDNVDLRHSEGNLTLDVALRQAVQVKSLVLPADNFYGQRLLVELTRMQLQVTAPVVATEIQAETVGTLTPGDSQDNAKIENIPAPSMTKVRQAPTAEQLARTAYQRGVAALQAGDRVDAQDQFEQALLEAPDLLEARLALIDLQLNDGNPAVTAVIEAGLTLHLHHPALTMRSAQWLFAAGDAERALLVLEMPPQPALADATDFHALKAALLQENGRFAEAALLYTELLQVDNRRPLWWMGRGIALEQIGDSVQAKQAYRQALVFEGLRPDVRDYLRGRLSVL